MEEEPERDDDFGGDRIQELVDEATKTGGSVNVDEDEWEAIERDQKEDKIMEKFKKRVRRCPDQVIRYDRRGLPLLCSSTPLPPAPPCNLCQDLMSLVSNNSHPLSIFLICSSWFTNKIFLVILV